MVCTAVPIQGMAIPYLPVTGRPRNRPKVSQTTRALVIARDHARCQICGEKVRPRSKNHDLQPSIDHIIRIRDGGRSQLDNLRLTHKGCNEERERLALMTEYHIFPSWWH